MRKKTVEKLMSAALALVLSVSLFSACDSQHANNEGKTEVWSTYNTLKVMRDSQDYPKTGAGLEVDMAIGETEGAQLIYTPENAVKNFCLTADDLMSGDKVFSVKNIRIFVQKYVEVKLKTSQQTNEKYPAGWIPDMLLPMEKAEEYGENYSEAGNNQGFYIEFTTNEDTLPGTYTGEFTLSLDSERIKLPVSVTVRDVKVEHSYGKNCWGLYQNMLWYGELDSSDEMYETYYSWLLKEYKVCLMHVPYALELDKFAASVKKYYDEPAFTSYGIPTFGTAANGGFFDEGAFNDFVYEIAKNCTPEKMYLDKAYVYPLMADEPSNATKKMLMNWVTVTCNNLEYVIIDRLNQTGFFDEYGGEEGDFAKQMAQALRDIPLIITTAEIEEFGDSVDTYCPTVEYFATEYMRDLYAEHEQNYSGETWFYTAMNPLYPYPSNHTDDYLIGLRSMRWMQMYWGLEGYLNWNIAYYTNADNYNDPARFYHYGAPFNGDGYMVYPAAKYGGETPYPSLRLVSYRDGQEDYDILSTYQELLTKTYGDLISVNDVFASSYEKVFSGAIYNTNDAEFLAERKALLSTAESLSGETGLVAYKTMRDGEDWLVAYAKAGSDLYVNGQKVNVQAEEGYVKYEERLTKSAVVKAVKDSTEATIEIRSGETKRAVTLSEDVIRMTDASSLTATDTGLKLNIQGKDGSLLELNSFKPGFVLNPSAVGGELSDLNSLTFVFENQTMKSYAVTVELLLKDGSRITLEKFIMEQGKNEVTISGIPLFYAHKKSKPEILRLIFPNTFDGETAATNEVTLTKMTYSLKENAK